MEVRGLNRSATTAPLCKTAKCNQQRIYANPDHVSLPKPPSNNFTVCLSGFTVMIINSMGVNEQNFYDKPNNSFKTIWFYCNTFFRLDPSPSMLVTSLEMKLEVKWMTLEMGTSEVPLFRKFPEIRKFQIERKDLRKYKAVSLIKSNGSKRGERFRKKETVSIFPLLKTKMAIYSILQWSVRYFCAVIISELMRWLYSSGYLG